MSVLEHLLVPLDGSAMAEQGLWVAAGIAERTGAELTLLHVMEHHPPSRVHSERHLQDAHEAEEYLQEAAGKLRAMSLRVSWHVHLQPTHHTAEGLGYHAEGFGADLVVMCAHGHVRLRDRLVGNLAQQLARRGAAPVLLLQTGRHRKVTFPFRRFLIPLDCQAEHEAGIEPAAALASICQAPVQLVTVISTLTSARVGESVTRTYLPGTTRLILDIREKEAAVYLQEHVCRLRERGLAASAQVARGNPASVIVSVTRESAADIVVLTTHGRTGSNAFWTGSLPPQLLRRLDTAFLLVPAKDRVTAVLSPRTS